MNKMYFQSDIGHGNITDYSNTWGIHKKWGYDSVLCLSGSVLSVSVNYLKDYDKIKHLWCY